MANPLRSFPLPSAPLGEDLSVTPASSEEYSNWSHPDLVNRILLLEARLRTQTAQIQTQLRTISTAPNTTTDGNPTAAATCVNDSGLTRSPSNSATSTSRRRVRAPRTFDPAAYSTRHIALRFAYLGQRYNGFEHSNGTVTQLPTIEEVLWKALRKARLISPPIRDGADTSYDVVWDPQERLRRYGDKSNGGEGLMQDINWERCQYSKCGRTDKGVSAFGQVIGIRLRSARPKKTIPLVTSESTVQEQTGTTEPADDMPSLDLVPEDSSIAFDPIKDELPYVFILNSILPPDIRILAWCPHPPADFDARFSCRQRSYKYFFTNPAFCPTPGPLGMQLANGRPAPVRDGWLDIPSMRDAASRLVGLHDFRNVCKVDASKQMTTFERRITFADIEEIDSANGPTGFTIDPALARIDGKIESERFASANGTNHPPRGPSIYSFTVHGSAFLWHQVRCMVSVLFLVGQGLEKPEVIDQLLDIRTTPCKPLYEMADDAPLVLWDCLFPNETSNGKDALDWIHAGDERSIPSLSTKSDGKFGTGGVVDGLWSQWRKSKVDEILSGSLFDLALGQGDRSALKRGGFRDLKDLPPRSQKIFEGGDSARVVGKYVPIMDKPRMDSVDLQNAKYRAGKGARRGWNEASAAD